MLAQQIAGRIDLAFPAKFQNAMVLVVGSLHAVRQIELQTGIAFSVVIDVANDRHEVRTICARIQEGMKLPVQTSPVADVLFFAQVIFESAEYGFRLAEDCAGESRD